AGRDDSVAGGLFEALTRFPQARRVSTITFAELRRCPSDPQRRKTSSTCSPHVRRGFPEAAERLIPRIWQLKEGSSAITMSDEFGDLVVSATNLAFALE